MQRTVPFPEIGVICFNIKIVLVKSTEAFKTKKLRSDRVALYGLEFGRLYTDIYWFLIPFDRIAHAITMHRLWHYYNFYIIRCYYNINLLVTLTALLLPMASTTYCAVRVCILCRYFSVRAT